MQKIYGLLYAMILLFGLRCYADTKFTFNNMTNEGVTILFFAYLRDKKIRVNDFDDIFHIPPYAQFYKKISSKDVDGPAGSHLCYQIAIAQPGTGVVDKTIIDWICNDASWNITKNKKGEFVFQRK